MCHLILEDEKHPDENEGLNCIAEVHRLFPDGEGTSVRHRLGNWALSVKALAYLIVLLVTHLVHKGQIVARGEVKD